jgi:hypothetical protein
MEAHGGDTDTAQHDFTRCGRPGQAEVVAQGVPGVLGAGDTALLQDRPHVVDERPIGTPIMSTAAERQAREHGSRIITAFEIRARYPKSPPSSS